VNIKNSNQKTEEKIIEKSFDVVLLLKSIFAIVEIIGGIAMFFMTPERVNNVIHWFSKSELHEVPNDFFINLIVNFGHHFTTGTQYLAAIYLLSHGLIKIITLFLLWRKILWSYPLSVVVFLGFIIYQLNEFATRHSIFMIIVSIVDVIMIVLTILEYRNLKHQKNY